MTLAALTVLLLAFLVAGARVRGRLAEWRSYVDWSRAQAKALARDRDAAAAAGARRRAEDLGRALADRHDFHNEAVRDYNRLRGAFPAVVVARLSGLAPAEAL
jgi:hypothetical protein